MGFPCAAPGGLAGDRGGAVGGAGWEPELLLDDEVYKVTFLESGDVVWPGLYQMRVLEAQEGTDLDAAMSRFDLSDLWEGEPRDTVIGGEPARTWVRWSADALIREFVVVLPRGVLHVSCVEETPNDPDLEAHRRVYEKTTASIVPLERKPRRAYVETGVCYGANVGDHSRLFSDWIGTFEVGYLRGARWGESESGFGYGGTIFLSAGAEDLRLAIKPRLRYRFHRNWATDVSAGLVFSTIANDAGVIDEGFAGGLALHYGSALTIKSDILIQPTGAYRESYYDSNGLNYIYHPPGTEVSVYGGVAFRGKPGWVTTGVGLAAIVVITVAIAIAWSSAPA